jgi:hypothetical protein
MNKQEMLKNLENIGLGDAIADTNASVDGTPAIVLRHDGAEEYYTGRDIYETGADPSDPTRDEYRKWLIENFK